MLTKHAEILKPATRKRRKKGKEKSRARGVQLVNLPVKVLIIVFEQLELADCAVLALTSKDLALKLDRNGFLDWDNVNKGLPQWHDHQTSEWHNIYSQIMHFTRNRLSKNFFPADLKYCWRCGKYVPRATNYWKEGLLDEFGNSRGEIGYKLMQWNEGYGDRVGHQRQQRGTTELEVKLKEWSEGNYTKTCPRCLLLSDRR